MKTIIIGGGHGCRSLLDITRSSFLKERSLQVVAVVDINADAPGLKYAENHGIDTFTSMTEAFEKIEFDVIIELTGNEKVLQQLHQIIKPGTRLIDHDIARVFWDLQNAQNEQLKQMQAMKELDAQLNNERFFLQAIFDSFGDLAVVISREHKIIKANRRFAQFVGIQPEDALGKTCTEVLANTEIECNPFETKMILNKVFNTGKTQINVHRTPPPEENFWELTRSPIYDEKGKIFGVLGTWHRITERVMLHREIESAEQRFKSFIHSAQDWISIKDLDGRYVIANPVTARAFDKNPEDFEGKRPDEILPPELVKTIKKHDDEVIKLKESKTYDEVIPIHGQDHVFQTVRFPLEDYKGELIGVCTIARDVTKEAHLQDQLAQSEKLAALGKLAAGVAHEINNPLTGILAYAEDMQDDTDDKFIIEDLQVIIRETLRCRDIVRNLLDFAKQDKPKLEDINPVEIIDHSLKLVHRLPQFKDIIIEKNVTEGLPKILSDPKQIQQVLLNLMLNAADAMKYKGKIILSADNDKKNNKVVISVEDTGPGIPENLVDKIFEPFFSTKGTNGLGLAVSWGIIERHHGTMEIDMSESGGAIFNIILPSIKK